MSKLGWSKSKGKKKLDSSISRRKSGAEFKNGRRKRQTPKIRSLLSKINLKN